MSQIPRVGVAQEPYAEGPQRPESDDDNDESELSNDNDEGSSSSGSSSSDDTRFGPEASGGSSASLVRAAWHPSHHLQAARGMSPGADRMGHTGERGICLKEHCLTHVAACGNVSSCCWPQTVCDRQVADSLTSRLLPS